MSRTRELLEELAGRAGLGQVPPKALIALAVVAVVAVAWAVSRQGGDGSGGSEFAFDDPAAVASSSVATEPAAASVETSVVVHVAGAVLQPGIVRLAAGCRVADALDAAGGALGNASLDAVNLARVLADGEQIYIPTAQEVADGAPGGPVAGAEPSGAASGAGATAAAGLVDLNSASEAELEELPGIGPSTATKIIADREANGPFAAPEDLMRVSGIGPKKFEALSMLVETR